MAVVIMYDWILSIDREVAYVWGSGWSSARAIYYTLRFSSFTSFIVTMFDFFPYYGKSSAVSRVPSKFHLLGTD